MSLPIAPNKLCQIYHNPNVPPMAPDVANVKCFLKPDWVAGREHGDRGVNQLTWTHVMLVDTSVDIRDSYSGNETVVPGDLVVIPDTSGTKFSVIFIELIHEGMSDAHKRVYLDRRTPTWPTNNL